MSSSRAARVTHARLIARLVRGPRGLRYRRPAHVSANLIYFGPDKKTHLPRSQTGGSLGKRRFSALEREPEVTRRLATAL